MGLSTPPDQTSGLGDLVEKATKFTGIKKATEIYTKVTGKSCGCAERKKKLNDMFPLKKSSPNEQ